MYTIVTSLLQSIRSNVVQMNTEISVRFVRTTPITHERQGTPPLLSGSACAWRVTPPQLNVHEPRRSLGGERLPPHQLGMKSEKVQVTDGVNIRLMSVSTSCTAIGCGNEPLRDYWKPRGRNIKTETTPTSCPKIIRIPPAVFQ